MPSQIIELEDGIRIEADTTRTQVSDEDVVVKSKIESIRPLIQRIVRPVVDSWDELGAKVTVDHAEIEVGFGIEASGHLFVASTKGNVNFRVKLVISRAAVTN